MPKSSINLASLNGKNGFKINGINAYDYSGTSLSSAGDVNLMEMCRVKAMWFLVLVVALLPT
jgi:hypothetical protein